MPQTSTVIPPPLAQNSSPALANLTDIKVTKVENKVENLLDSFLKANLLHVPQ